MPVMVSPAQKLLQKLYQKQQSPESNRDSPLILFQYSCHVSLRETAATRTSSTIASSVLSRVQQQQQAQHAKVQDEADLYRRAQLRNPSENARRSTWGGPLWVEYLTKELMRLSPHGMVWISTSTRPIPTWIENSQVSVVSATFLYQSKWEDDSLEEEPRQRHPPMTLLFDRIFARIRTDTATCTPFVIESLTPLVILYGFSSVLIWLQQLLAIPHALVLLPVLSETFHSCQHQQLEDLAQTVLWLSNHTGQVDLHVLRRGIREQDSMVREIWNFSLQQSASDTAIKFSLVVGNGHEEDIDEHNAPDTVNLLLAMSPALNPDTKPQQTQQPDPTVVKQPKKITLTMEDDDNRATPHPSTANTSNTPRIFLQDDDPEFEDYDEEDPDDDLEI